MLKIVQSGGPVHEAVRDGMRIKQPLALDGTRVEASAYPLRQRVSSPPTRLDFSVVSQWFRYLHLDQRFTSSEENTS